MICLVEKIRTRLSLYSLFLVFALAYVVPYEIVDNRFMEIGFPVRFFRVDTRFLTGWLLTSASLNLLYLLLDCLVVYWSFEFLLRIYLKFWDMFLIRREGFGFNLGVRRYLRGVLLGVGEMGFLLLFISFIVVFVLTYVVHFEFVDKYLISVSQPARFFDLYAKFHGRSILSLRCMNLFPVFMNSFVLFWILVFSGMFWKRFREMCGILFRKFFRKSCDDQKADSKQ